MAASRRIFDVFSYIIALGSNRRHGLYGAPHRVLAAALCAMSDAGLALLRVSPIIHSRPLGPSLGGYANGAVVAETGLSPPEILHLLKKIEGQFGRRRGGQRWAARVLDLDIILWSGGTYRADNLQIPHVEFRQRGFVLGPIREIAADWRDPMSHLSVNQLYARLTKRPMLLRGRRGGARSSVGRATDF
ncbi:MAG: 2-amino-4-hydroxy-6-hydroxymethyldihydropteridine diphosphokinase [Pseudomonadota bacterium]